MGRMGYDDSQLKAHRKRTTMSAVMIFIMIPLTLWLSVKFLDSTKYMIMNRIEATKHQTIREYKYCKKN